jgi:hypothetical protein
MATRGRRKADSTSKISLVQALAFAEGVLKSDRDFKQKHVYIGHGMLVGFDGTLAAGHPISEDIEAVPHSGKLLKALERSDETVQVTLNDSKRLSVKAGKFRAVIECLDVGEFYSPQGDKSIAVIGETLRDGFKAITHIVNHEADKVHFATVLIRAGSMMTTDGRTLFEYWHGIDLPEMALPKAAATAITKTDKKLVGFGFSGHSATFHFEGGAWIRSQLFADRWPDVSRVLDVKTNAWPVSPTLFAAARAVRPFCKPDDEALTFFDEAIGSHSLLTEGAVHEVPGLLAGPVFNAEQLAQIEPLVKTIDFTTKRGHAYFFGDNVRGAIAGMGKSEQAKPAPKTLTTEELKDMRNDIPY